MQPPVNKNKKNWHKPLTTPNQTNTNGYIYVYRYYRLHGKRDFTVELYVYSKKKRKKKEEKIYIQKRQPTRTKSSTINSLVWHLMLFSIFYIFEYFRIFRIFRIFSRYFPDISQIFSRYSLTTISISIFLGYYYISNTAPPPDYTILLITTKCQYLILFIQRDRVDKKWLQFPNTTPHLLVEPINSSTIQVGLVDSICSTRVDLLF